MKLQLASLALASVLGFPCLAAESPQQLDEFLAAVRSVDRPSAEVMEQFLIQQRREGRQTTIQDLRVFLVSEEGQRRLALRSMAPK